ncbi:hypothetical protein AVEN_65979-1 [Araneus ventricosus]|uniref:Uncharacterized protein n=1 Tax=Araneus ventricosus TaxID=182803 RepID=A0A4Y2FZ26_ARAVE|nr:hypothetical protein AVEN_65979-1 [Araneus ventricosus]
MDQLQTVGKKQIHLEPLVIACHLPVEESDWNTPWFADSTLQVRKRFERNNELFTNTSRRGARLSLCSKKNWLATSGFGSPRAVRELFVS